MENSFHFVDGFRPDRASKKLMRRHVMRGKNAGKQLRRRSRKDLTSVDVHPFKETSFLCPGRQEGNSIRFSKSFGHETLTGVPLLVEVNPHSLGIIDKYFSLTSERLYPTKIGFPLSEAKRLWLSLLFPDETAYHCDITLMETFNEIYLGRDNKTQTLLNRSKTLIQIQRRVESCDALSDSTIGLITSLITQEQIRNQRSAALVDARGLQQMVELRGGLCQLDQNPPLVLAVCIADVLLSLQFCEPAMFFRDNLTALWNIMASKNYDFNDMTFIPNDNLNPYLYTIFCDTVEVCSLLNENIQQPILDLINLEEIFVSICYCLLRFNPIHQLTEKIDSQAALSVGLLIFTMTAFFQMNEKRIIDFNALSVRFESLLRGDLSGLGDDLSLWLLAMGGIWFRNQLETDHFVSKMRNVCSRRKIYNWIEFRAYISRFPWIAAIHDRLGEELWIQTQQITQ